MMTCREAITSASARLWNSDSSRLDAELLLAYVLNQSREYLVTWPEKTLSESQQQHFDYLVQARIEGQPIAYLTGKRAFWTFELAVTPDVLIPRPETELLVEQALESLPATPLKIADLGTGSGAVALALASERPQWEVIATELSDKALAIAQINVQKLGVGNISLIKSDWCLAVSGHLDAIVSNPPYIETGDPHLHEGDVHFEPRMALIAGKTGLESIYQITSQAREQLKPGGWLMLEHAYNQAQAVRRLLEEHDFEQVTTRKDLAGLDRVTAGRCPGRRAGAYD